MVAAIIIIAIIALILVVWWFIELKRMNHKFIAIFLVCLILFLFFSITFVFKDKQVDYKSVSGVFSASKIYFSWLGSAFGNMKLITSNAVKMNWKGNETISTNSTSK